MRKVWQNDTTKLCPQCSKYLCKRNILHACRNFSYQHMCSSYNSFHWNNADYSWRAWPSCAAIVCPLSKPVARILYGSSIRIYFIKKKRRWVLRKQKVRSHWHSLLHKSSLKVLEMKSSKSWIELYRNLALVVSVSKKCWTVQRLSLNWKKIKTVYQLNFITSFLRILLVHHI